MIISVSIHVTADGIISFSLWLSSIPLYICTTSSLPIHPSVDIEVFYVLAVVNNAAMNIGVHVFFFFELQFCLDICPGLGLLDYMAILFSVFCETSIVATPIYIPTNSVGSVLENCYSEGIILGATWLILNAGC